MPSAGRLDLAGRSPRLEPRHTSMKVMRCTLGPDRVRWLAFLILAMGTPTAPASAHTRWADGAPVPEWVRNACCGPSDVHHLSPNQVQATPDGYRVEGVEAIVPFAKTLVSQDGDYWIFYRDFPDGTQFVFCFFAPPTGY